MGECGIHVVQSPADIGKMMKQDDWREMMSDEL
jgi:hypothetical protein